MKILGIVVVLLVIAAGGYFLLTSEGEPKNLEEGLPVSSTDDGSQGMEVPAPGSIGANETVSHDNDSHDGTSVEGGVQGETTGSNPTTETTSSVPTTEPGKEAPKTITIDYSSSGYSPKDVSISVGDTVRFINTSTSRNWPASDFHPTHTVYPGSNISKCDSDAIIFDSCGPIAEGDSFEFTFNEAGNWKYHNHLSAGKKGTITVK